MYGLTKKKGMVQYAVCTRRGWSGSSKEWRKVLENPTAYGFGDVTKGLKAKGYNLIVPKEML